MEDIFLIRGKRLGEAVKYLRNTKRVRTQTELAEVVGCSKNQLSRAIAGSEKDLTQKFIGRINDAFDDIFNEKYIWDGKGTLLKEPEEIPKTPVTMNQEAVGAEGLTSIISSLVTQLSFKDEQLAKKDMAISKKDDEIDFLKQQIEEKDKTIALLRRQLEIKIEDIPLAKKDVVNL